MGFRGYPGEGHEGGLWNLIFDVVGFDNDDDTDSVVDVEGDPPTVRPLDPLTESWAEEAEAAKQAFTTCNARYRITEKIITCNVCTSMAMHAILK